MSRQIAASDVTPFVPAALAGLGVATPKQLMASAPLGTSTAFVASPSSPIRLAAQLSAITSGQAIVTVDGSNDGITTTVQLGSFLLDTVGQTIITPPFNLNTTYFRFTVLSGTGATVNVWMGI